MKYCSKCKIEKDETEFSKDSRAKSGLQSSCKKCFKDYWYNNIKILHTQKKFYYVNNIEKIKEASKNYYHTNKDIINKKAKKNYLKNPKKYNSRCKEYNLSYKGKIKNNIRLKAKLENNHLFKLSVCLRKSIGSGIKRGGYSKRHQTSVILGCSFKEFKLHIEKQFREGMNWDNYGEWELDHIYPVSLAKNEQHLLHLNHYTNFQPLWREDNRRKGNKLL
ncbi:MAG: hypothetical protein PHG08_00675 [Bacilli bacterium]|nr:hypothetical protein [Bacilli bacterium]